MRHPQPYIGLWTVRNWTAEQEVSSGLFCEASAVFIVAPHHWHYCLSFTSCQISRHNRCNALESSWNHPPSLVRGKMIFHKIWCQKCWGPLLSIVLYQTIILPGISNENLITIRGPVLFACPKVSVQKHLFHNCPSYYVRTYNKQSWAFKTRKGVMLSMVSKSLQKARHSKDSRELSLDLFKSMIAVSTLNIHILHFLNVWIFNCD